MRGGLVPVNYTEWVYTNASWLKVGMVGHFGVVKSVDIWKDSDTVVVEWSNSFGPLHYQRDEQVRVQS